MKHTPIHWLTQSATDVPAAAHWLAASESATLERLRIPKRRDDWRLGRWTAKRAVLAYLDERCAAWPLGRIAIRATESGAPEVFLDRRPLPVTISISHGAGLAVCAIAPVGVALGCDIEVITARSEAFVADYFTGEERLKIGRAPSADQAALATLMWSAKESALKALREGLRLDTRSVGVTVHDRKPVCGWYPMSVQYSDTGQVFDGWWRSDRRCVLAMVAYPSPCPPVSLVARERTSLRRGRTAMPNDLTVTMHFRT
jgi:4'-phosphopantetheinyl transferase